MKISSENTEEKRLWQGFKNGNSNCFNILFRKFYSELYHYGIKVSPDPELVKEAIQEVFIRIWETRATLGNAENIKSYLIVSLRRMIMTKLKTDKSKHHIEFGKADQSSFFFEIDEFEKHEEISPEIRAVLLKSINSLTKRQRELIQLYFYHELPYPETAKTMKMSIQATRNLMYRTLTHLRKEIGEKPLKDIKNMLILFFSSKTIKKL